MTNDMAMKGKRIETPTPKSKKLQTFSGILNYLSMFLLATSEVCESLQRLTSATAGTTPVPQHPYGYRKCKASTKVVHLQHKYK